MSRISSARSIDNSRAFELEQQQQTGRPKQDNSLFDFGGQKQNLLGMSSADSSTTRGINGDSKAYGLDKTQSRGEQEKYLLALGNQQQDLKSKSKSEDDPSTTEALTEIIGTLAELIGELVGLLKGGDKENNGQEGENGNNNPAAGQSGNSGQSNGVNPFEQPESSNDTQNNNPVDRTGKSGQSGNVDNSKKADDSKNADGTQKTEKNDEEDRPEGVLEDAHKATSDDLKKYGLPDSYKDKDVYVTEDENGRSFIQVYDEEGNMNEGYIISGSTCTKFEYDQASQTLTQLNFDYHEGQTDISNPQFYYLGQKYTSSLSQEDFNNLIGNFKKIYDMIG